MVRKLSFFSDLLVITNSIRLRVHFIILFSTMILLTGCGESSDAGNIVKGRLISRENQPLQEVTLRLLIVPRSDEKKEIESKGIKRVSYFVSRNSITLDHETVYDRNDNLFLTTEYYAKTDAEGYFIFTDIDRSEYSRRRFSIFVTYYIPPLGTEDALVREYKPPQDNGDALKIVANQILYDRGVAVSFELKDDEAIDLGELVFPSY